MSKHEELEIKINELRVLLHELICDNNMLTDPETVTASQMLDGLLNEYNKILRKKL